MRLAARRLLALVVAVLISVAVGTFLPRPFARSAHGSVTVPPRRILVLSNAIHTDIAIPLARDTRASFAFLARSGLPVDNPGARWLVVGWGGRAFYIETPSWSDLKPLPVFRALTIDGSVLHVGLSGPIDRTDAAVTAFDLDEGGFDRLISYVLASFALRPEEAAAIPEVGYGQYDKGISLIRQGIAKGHLKQPDDAMLHLAYAQMRAGKTADAKTSFANVHGQDGGAALAQLWLLVKPPQQK